MIGTYAPPRDDRRSLRVDATERATTLAGWESQSDESIPRSFLAAADVTALVFAFLTAGYLAPWVQWLLLPSGPLSVSLPEWLSIPAEPSFDQFPTLGSMSWVLVVTSPLSVFFMELLGGYTSLAAQSRTRLALSTVLAPMISLSFIALAFFALKGSTSSRIVIFTFGASSVLILFAYRAALRSYKRRRLAAGDYAKSVVLIGNRSAVSWMADHFRRRVPSTYYRLNGWLDPAPASPQGTESLARLGCVDQLGTLLVHHPIHEVVAIVQSSGERDWLRQVIEECNYFRVRLRIVPEALTGDVKKDFELAFRSEILGLPQVVLSPPHLDSDSLFIKRMIDIVVSGAALVLLSPVLLMVAIAIKLTTPQLPVLYPWRVVGLKGVPFTGYKFTTMFADADTRKADLMPQNEMTGPVFKLKDDPRATPFGRFLRKYSINELPQLWSVLKGDMSLVGPRPAFRHELDRYELWHKRKLCVKPGITCLWQVSGRNRISDFNEWVRLDLQYIQEWSLWLDFRILARTLWAVVSGSGS